MPARRVPPLKRWSVHSLKPTARAVLSNSVWLMADKVVRLGFGLIVTIWIARHFGPAMFGLWNYAIAFAALFGALASLGLDGVVVRELVRNQNNAATILCTTATLRFSAAVLAVLAAALAIHWMRPGQSLVLLLVALNASVFVLQTSQVIDLHFQSQMKAKWTVTAMNSAFLLTSAARMWLLWISAPIEYFAMSLVAEAALAAAFMVVAYRRDGHEHRRWRFDAGVARHLLSESWPLLLSGLTVIIYMRLDQVMLASIAGDEAVGQFSAALRISEVWYFIPMAIATSAFPAILSKRLQDPQAYEDFVQSLYDGMVWMAMLVAVTTSFFAPLVISHLYGPSYAEAATILSIQVWAGVTVAMSFVHGKWLLAEGLQRYGLVYTALGACVNVGLNLMLIPRFGAIGAAYATLVTQIGLMPVQLFFPKARRNFLLMIRAFAAPYRLLARWS